MYNMIKSLNESWLTWQRESPFFFYGWPRLLRWCWWFDVRDCNWVVHSIFPKLNRFSHYTFRLFIIDDLLVVTPFGRTVKSTTPFCSMTYVVVFHNTKKRIRLEDGIPRCCSSSRNYLSTPSKKQSQCTTWYWQCIAVLPPFQHGGLLNHFLTKRYNRPKNGTLLPEWIVQLTSKQCAPLHLSAN